jgi:hypothetical protein
MLHSSKTHSTRTVVTVLDCVLILAGSLLIEAAHFAGRQGRYVLSPDAVQYVDGAEALIDGRQNAHFDYRKPGYSIVLAAVSLFVGNMGWAAVVVNYALGLLLPLLAYALGLRLCSRSAGWLAAILVITQLDGSHRAERIMSENVYAFALTLGILVFSKALAQQRTAIWAGASGMALGFAWLTRSAASGPIGAAALVLVGVLWRSPARAAAAFVAYTVPIAACVLVECALNDRFAGRFRPCTGTNGSMLLLRTRYTLGLPFPETKAARDCLSLVPERTGEDAYRHHLQDAWVAWHRAVQDRGLDTWTFERTARTAALEMIAKHPWPYLRSFAAVFVRQLLRQDGDPSIRRLPSGNPPSVLLPEGIPDGSDSRESWYLYWTLPRRSPAEAAALIDRMRAAAEEKAPFGDGPIWRRLRSWSREPILADVFGLLRALATLWPGWALVFYRRLGLNPGMCLLVALAYLTDALIVGATAFGDNDIERFQYVWLAVDAALVGGLIAGLVRRPDRSGLPDPSRL